ILWPIAASAAAGRFSTIRKARYCHRNAEDRLIAQIPGSLVTSAGWIDATPLLQSGFRCRCIPATFHSMPPAPQKRPPPEQPPQPRPRPAPSAMRMPRWLKRLAWLLLIVVLVILLLPYLLVPLYRVVDPVSTLMLWRWAHGQRVERSFVPIERM